MLTCLHATAGKNGWFSLVATEPPFVCDPKCDDNADCKNFTGSSSCMCKAGFDGDGITCTG